MDQNNHLLKAAQDNYNRLENRLEDSHEANRKRITALENQVIQLMSLAKDLQLEITDMKLAAEDI